MGELIETEEAIHVIQGKKEREEKSNKIFKALNGRYIGIHNRMYSNIRTHNDNLRRNGVKGF